MNLILRITAITLCIALVTYINNDVTITISKRNLPIITFVSEPVKTNLNTAPLKKYVNATNTHPQNKVLDRAKNLDMLNAQVSGEVNNLIPYIDELVKKHSPTERKDIKCLARNLFFEARGEIPAGKLAAAYIPITRHKENNDMSICDVIHYKKNKVCAFSWVCELKSKLHINDTIRSESLKYKESLVISYIAYNSMIEDPTKKANHYYNPDIANPSWAKKMIPVSNKFIKNGILGNHRFLIAKN